MLHDKYNVAALVLLLVFSITAAAYEPDTHKKLSLIAIENSILASSTSNILSDFGLSTDIGPLSSSQNFPNSEGIPKSIILLIQDGANFEDNFPRSIQHFYDPINDKGLQHPAVSAFTNKSPDWALEDTGQISGQNYSYADAMNAFNDALTLPTKAERDAKWGQVFETLGHVIHHIQDMGQPEHVRNDLHCDAVVPCGFPGALIGLYDKSLFESRSKAVFRAGIPAALTGYPAVTFPTTREFWTTRATDAIPARRGIADFTNRNFVSKDRNFEIKAGIASASSLYDLPVPSGSNIQTLASLLPNNNQGADICQQLNQVGPIDLPPNAPCEIGFIENVVTDSYTPSSTTNQRAASLSLFDQYLTKYIVNGVLVEDGDAFHQMDVDRLPTINRFNIDAAHTYLIPRVVAYSAGLIDHFFRGKISLEKDVVSGNWIVKNITNENMQGTFTLFSKTGGIQQAVAGATWDTVTQVTGGVLTAQSQMNVVAAVPQNYDSLILVFRGLMGGETDIESIAGFVYRAGWSTPVMIKDNSLATSVVVNAGGNVAAAWMASNQVFADYYNLDTGWNISVGLYTQNVGHGIGGGDGCKIWGTGALKISENGDAALCFIDGGDILHNNVFCNLYSESSGWSSTMQISALGTANVEERLETLALAFDDIGGLTVMWEQSIFNPPDFSDDRIISKEYTASSGWSVETTAVLPSGDPRALVRIDVNNNKKVMASFYNSSNLPYKAAYRSTGGSWTISTLPSFPLVLGVCETTIDAMGNAMVVWRQRDAIDTSVWSGYYTEIAGWSDIAQFTRISDIAQLGFDGYGNALAVWSLQTSPLVRFARYVPNTTGWGPPVVISYNAPPTANITSLDLAVDSAGNAWAVWILDDSGYKTIWTSRYTAN